MKTMTLTLLAFAVVTQVANAAAPAAPDDGAALAPVDVVLYSDFQCPFCAQFAQPFRELQTTGIDGVKTTVQFKHFPLSIHPNAQLVHQASVAAKAQGKFWEMHDLLFANQQRAQKDDLLGYARKLELDLARFQTDMDSLQTKQAIASDLAQGTALGVTGTPSYTIGGKLEQLFNSVERLTSRPADSSNPVTRTPVRIRTPSVRAASATACVVPCGSR